MDINHDNVNARTRVSLRLVPLAGMGKVIKTLATAPSLTGMSEHPERSLKLAARVLTYIK
jgi:hypothetical protein